MPTGAIATDTRMASRNLSGFTHPAGKPLMRTIFVISVVALLSQSGISLAGPAAWYRWQNANDPLILCSQTPPGDGWVMVQGPFRDSACRKPGQPD